MTAGDLTFNIRLINNFGQTGNYFDIPISPGNAIKTLLKNQCKVVFYDDLFLPEFDIRYKGECIARPYLLHKHFVLRPILRYKDYNKLSINSPFRPNYNWSMYRKNDYDKQFIPEIRDASTPEQVSNKFFEIIDTPDYNTLPNDYQKYLRLYYSKNIDEIELSQTDSRYSKYNTELTTNLTNNFDTFKKYEDKYYLSCQYFKLPIFFGHFHFTNPNLNVQQWYHERYNELTKTKYRQPSENDNNYSLIAYELICIKDFYTISRGDVITSNVMNILIVPSTCFNFKADENSHKDIYMCLLSKSENNNSIEINPVYADSDLGIYNEQYFLPKIYRNEFLRKYTDTPLGKILFTSFQNFSHIDLYSYAYNILGTYSRIEYPIPPKINQYYSFNSSFPGGIKAQITNGRFTRQNINGETKITIDRNDSFSSYGNLTAQEAESIIPPNIKVKREFFHNFLSLINIYQIENFNGNFSPIQNSLTFYEYFLDENNWEITNVYDNFPTNYYKPEKDLKFVHQQQFIEEDYNVDVTDIEKMFSRCSHVFNQLEKRREYVYSNYNGEYIITGNLVDLYKKIQETDKQSILNIFFNNTKLYYTRFEYYSSGTYNESDIQEIKETPFVRYNFFGEKNNLPVNFTTFSSILMKNNLPQKVFTNSVWKQKENSGVVTRKLIYENDTFNTQITIKIDNSKDYAILVY